jgi:hypothetical protein
MTRKICRLCKEEKDLNDFYVNSGMPDGHINHCKECRKTIERHRRQMDVERWREHDRNRSMLPHRVAARMAYAKTEAGIESHNKASSKWTQNNKEKRHAQYVLNNAIRDGKAQREVCCVCGGKAQAHHEDYSKPLDVIWLCPRHHSAVHSHIRQQNRYLL